MKQNSLARIMKDESGATAIEYGLIVAFIAVAVIGVFGTLSEKIVDLFDDIGGKLVLPADK
jgi:pilus assembly protein Flp/PilA